MSLGTGDHGVVVDRLSLGQFIERRQGSSLHIGGRHAGLGQVDRPVEEILCGVGVGADLRQAHVLQQPQGLGRTLQRRGGQLEVRRGNEWTVAVEAMLVEQRLATVGLRPIDGAEVRFIPNRRLQCLQRPLDRVEVRQQRRRAEAFFLRQGLAFPVHEGVFGADAHRLADVASHRLAHRRGVLHPVKLPDIPHRRKADRRVADAVVHGVEILAEHLVGNTRQRVGAAKTLVSGRQLLPPFGEPGTAERRDHPSQFRVQPHVVPERRIAQHLLRKAPELQRVGRRAHHRRDHVRAELARRECRERVHGLPAVNANGRELVTALDAQLAGVARRAGDVEQLVIHFAIEVLGKSDRQLVRVRGTGLVDDEPVGAQVVGVGKPGLAPRVLEVHKPAVPQPRHASALAGVVESLP